MPRRVKLRSLTSGGSVSGVSVASLDNGTAITNWLAGTHWTNNGTTTLYCDTTSAVTWVPYPITAASNLTISNATFYWPINITCGGGVTFENCGWQTLEEPQQRVHPNDQATIDRALADAHERVRRINTDRRTKEQAADERAMQLLKKMLTTEQQQQFEKDRYFEVIARASKRRYRIREGVAGNIRLVDPSGREISQYCAHPDGLPTGDVMLAQKLQIELDEEAFLRVANRTNLLQVRRA